VWDQTTSHMAKMQKRAESVDGSLTCGEGDDILANKNLINNSGKGGVIIGQGKKHLGR